MRWKNPRDYYYSNLIPQVEPTPSKSFHKIFDALKVDPNFWLGLPVLDNHIPKDVEMYLTARECPDEVTREWLDKHDFPKLPLTNVHYTKRHKVDVATEAGMHGHIDDKSDTFIACVEDLPHSFLASRPWNIDVITPRRIYRLEEVDWRS